MSLGEINKNDEVIILLADHTAHNTGSNLKHMQFEARKTIN